MRIVHTLPELHDARRRLGPCALVPTMGNLHDGHLSLIAKAQDCGLPVVTSIFVNRLQFAPTDDFGRYPRTLEGDCKLLAAAGCDLVFAPADAELYPLPQSFLVQPDPDLAGILEGEFRPGFFVGVCTVVMKLFGCVQPEAAVFGKKDYQQFLVLREMVKQFALPIDVQAGQTLRTSAGLALSSRNVFLSAAEQAQAIELPQALAGLARAYREGRTSLPELESNALKAMADTGWQPDYLTVRRRCDLQPPGAGGADDAVDTPLVALGAARLGATRLIDNLEF